MNLSIHSLLNESDTARAINIYINI